MNDTPPPEDTGEHPLGDEIEWIRQQSPVERARYLDERRSGLLQSGAPTFAVDIIERAMRSADRDALRWLAGWSWRVIETFCSSHRGSLFELPAAVSYRLVMDATLGFLLGQGLVSSDTVMAGLAQTPQLWRDAIPEHLQPPVGVELAQYRMRKRQLPPDPDSPLAVGEGE